MAERVLSSPRQTKWSRQLQGWVFGQQQQPPLPFRCRRSSQYNSAEWERHLNPNSWAEHPEHMGEGNLYWKEYSHFANWFITAIQQNQCLGTHHTLGDTPKSQPDVILGPSLCMRYKAVHPVCMQSNLNSRCPILSHLLLWHVLQGFVWIVSQRWLDHLMLAMFLHCKSKWATWW